MKFRDFAELNRGKKRKKHLEVKEEVKTPIGRTDKKFLKTVARDSYILETSVGFGMSKMELKRVFDYIKSWLIRYDIKYEAMNPYLTVATVHGNYKRSDLIKELKNVRKNEEFEPEGVFLLREDNKDYIIIDFLHNKKFVGKLNETFSRFGLEKQETSCFVKLFSIDKESFDLNIFDEMIYSLPEIPRVTGGNVGLLVRRI